MGTDMTPISAGCRLKGQNGPAPKFAETYAINQQGRRPLTAPWWRGAEASWCSVWTAFPRRAYHSKREGAGKPALLVYAK